MEEYIKNFSSKTIYRMEPSDKVLEKIKIPLSERKELLSIYKMIKEQLQNKNIKFVILRYILFFLKNILSKNNC